MSTPGVPNAGRGNIIVSEHLPKRVYILRRVVREVAAFCGREMPREALGVLVGWRCQHHDLHYVRIVDWATGRVESSTVYAKFTRAGVAEYHIELDERYGAERTGPRVVGVFHSHPFGREPSLSARDGATFDAFPYHAPENVFVLVNPRTGHFLVYQHNARGELVEREWVDYAPSPVEVD